jgi:Family of unknown function (DUF5675)
MLATYTLVREPSTPDGTLGEMFDPDGGHLCFTMELPWENNEPDKSCIPTGTYTCVPHNSVAHPGTWELLNVPDRSEILIHTGNTDADSLGCILVGRTIGSINGTPAVLLSAVAFHVMKQTVPSTFQLEINNANPLDKLLKA